jgi:hypothetical protein
VISRAPITFIVGAIIVSAAVWAGATAFYQEELATARQQRDYWKDRAQTTPVVVRAPLSPPPLTPLAAPAAIRRHSPRASLSRPKPAPTQAVASALPPPPPSSPAPVSAAPAPCGGFWSHVGVALGNTIAGPPGGTFNYSSCGGAFLGNTVVGYGNANVQSEGVMSNNAFMGPNPVLSPPPASGPPHP